MSLKFVSSLPEVGSRPEVETLPGGQFVGALPKALSGEKVRERLRDAIHEMSEYLNSMKAQSGPFQLDEAEMILQIDQSGKVNLIVADVGGKISGGIRLKWKRDKSQQII